MWQFVFGIFFEVFTNFSKKLVNLQQNNCKIPHQKEKMIFKMDFGIIHFDVIPRRHLKLTYKGLLWSLPFVSFSLPFLAGFHHITAS
jgi:hypothetical protein